MLPHLLELTMNNICSTDITQTIVESGPRLMKLKLSNINLNSVTDTVCEILETGSPLLQAIDFSWSFLTPANLEIITYSILARKSTIRHLNLSYNKLHPNCASSVQVVENLKELFWGASVLCHVRLSGMDFN